MKIKTSELEGAALDWAYMKAKPLLLVEGERRPIVKEKGKRRIVERILGKEVDIPEELAP